MCKSSDKSGLAKAWENVVLIFLVINSNKTVICLWQQITYGSWIRRSSLTRTLSFPILCQTMKIPIFYYALQGFGVFSKLSQIAMYTTDSNLRGYLMEQLGTEGKFTETDQQAINFASEVDKMYPCQSYQEAMAVRLRYWPTCTETEMWLCNCAEWSLAYRLCVFVRVYAEATLYGRNVWGYSVCVLYMDLLAEN